MPLTAQQIEQSPKFKELVAKRRSLNLSLTVLTLMIYFGFILLVACAPKVLGTPIAKASRRSASGRLGSSSRPSLSVGVYVLKRQRHFDGLTSRSSGNPVMRATSSTSRPRFDAVPRRPVVARRLSGPSDRRGRSRQPTGRRSPCSSVRLLTLGITYWAAKRTSRPRNSIRPAAASPASRTASPSPATICRPPRFSAFPASSTLSGYDGLIYSVGWLVGWPIVTFLIAEPLAQSRQVHLRRRRLVPPRPDADPHPGRLRLAGHGGLLSDRADGRRRQADPDPVRPGLLDRVVIVGVLMISTSPSAACSPPPGCRSSRPCCCSRRDLHGAAGADDSASARGAVRQGGRGPSEALAIMEPGS